MKVEFPADFSDNPPQKNAAVTISQKNTASQNTAAAVPQKTSAAVIPQQTGNQKVLSVGSTVQNGPALKADGWAPLLTSLGLPVDQLSRTILSFAKFFSLPFDPGLLANARKAGFGGKDREAQALANLAAADKGVSATPAALQEYASLLHVFAVDPDAHNGDAPNEDAHGGDDRQSGQNPADETSPDDGSRPDASESRSDRGSGQEYTRDRDAALQMKEQFLTSASRSKVLDLFNRLPGKNGRRWLVFPLSFTENGALYSMSLRILLDGDRDNGIPSVRRMSLDIAFSRGNAPTPLDHRPTGQSGAGAADQHWLFILDNPAPALASGSRTVNPAPQLTLFLYPERRPLALQTLARTLSGVMGLASKNITVTNSRASDFLSDCSDNVLLSVYKEV